MSAATQSEATLQSEATVATRFDRTDWMTIATMGGIVLALHVFGWGVLVLGVAPQHITLGSAGVFGVGLGVTAYLLGVRHAFDADHIAVIDNTTRKLVGEGTRSLSAGFWFSLGHSSVVFGLAFLLAIGVRAVVGPVQDEGSPAAADARPGGLARRRYVPDSDRAVEPVRRGRHRQGLPPDARR